MDMRVSTVFGSGSSSGKGGGGASHVATEEENTLQSNTLAKSIHLISSGPCVGLTNGAKSIFFDKTALLASNGVYNFSGVSWAQRTGEAEQAYIEGFSSVASVVSVNTEVKKSADVIRTLPGPIDACRVTVGIPYLAYQDPSTGDLLHTNVSFALYRRPTGTSTWSYATGWVYNDKCVSLFQESFRINLGGDTDWDIKFVRITDDSTQSNLKNETTWVSTSLITDGKFSYPNCGLVSLVVNAKLFGNTIPNIAFDWTGCIIRIPTSYDPVNHTYASFWDGTFTTAWTDNPAWVLYDILTDAESGLGSYINEDQIDIYSLYEIAKYCDELVPDGFGGTERRYTFNYQFTTSMDAATAVQLVASSFHGVVYWTSGQVFFFADMPQDPVKLFNQSNVIGGVFTYEGTALSTRHSAAYVTWFDMDDMCNQAVELVVNNDLVSEFSWRDTSTVVYGCTSRGRAHRFGRWILDTESNAPDTCNFEVSWTECGVKPGDIVEIADPYYAGVRYGGRVTGYTSTSVTIDQAITISVVNRPYTLKVYSPDGTIIERNVTNGASTTNTLTFDTPITETLVDGAVWNLSSNEVNPRQFRVMSVVQATKATLAITAVGHDPTKYDRIERDLKLDPISYTRFSNDKPSAPTNIDVSEYVYKYNLTVKSGATITWTAPSDASMVREYIVEIRNENGDWRSLGSYTGTTADAKDIDSGGYYIRVRSVGFTGVTSEWFTKRYVMFESRTPPATVSNFSIHPLGQTSTISWDANTELDIDYYTVKYSPLLSGVTWSSSTPLIEKVYGTSVQVPSRPGTYLIKAVDLGKKESDQPAIIVTEVSALGMNAVAAVSDYPSWSGAKDTLVVDGVTLKLSGEAVGTYSFASFYDLGGTYTSYLSAAIDAYSGASDDFWDTEPATWADKEGTWSPIDPSAWRAYILVRTTQDDPSGAPVWSAWETLIAGYYTARAFEFILVVENFKSNVVTVVADASVLIDMPDRTVEGNNLTAPTTGYTVSFSPAFRSAPSVGITGQNMQTGDYHTYTSGPTASGFTIVFKDYLGVAVERNFDYIAVGVGYAG